MGYSITSAYSLTASRRKAGLAFNKSSNNFVDRRRSSWRLLEARQKSHKAPAWHDSMKTIFTKKYLFVK
jgi:hypothetical protein